MKQIVIIGNSAAGINAAEAVRKVSKDAKILMISDEPHLGYCRCLISYFLAGSLKQEDLIIRPQQFYDDLKIQLMLGKKVERVNVKKNCLHLVDEKTKIDYDALILATGGHPKIPEDLKGINKNGVFGFRTIEDAKKILGIIPITRTACVLGGGLIGLKSVYGLHKRGLEVKVVVKSNRVLSQMLDEKGAQFFKTRLEEHGVEVILGRDVTEIFGNGDVKAIKLDTGKVIGCGIVVVGKGVDPNIRLIDETGIKVEKGIAVNEFLKTNISNIFAAGDVAQTHDLVWEAPDVNALWPVAVEQGKIAGLNAAFSIEGKEKDMAKYDGSLGMNAVEFFDLPVISMGIVNKPRERTEEYEELAITDKKRSIYRKVMLRSGRVVGFIGVGKLDNSGVFLKLIKEKADVSKIKDDLLSENFSYACIRGLIRETEQIYI